MSLFSVLLSFIFLFSVVVVPLQLNLYLTEWVGNNEDDNVLQHDCLRVNTWDDEEDLHEITLYCISEWPSKWNSQTNDIDTNFTFAELFELDITSEQLYLWSAPMDIVENYQFYLDQRSTSNEMSTTTYWFFNCTVPKFGPMCQYSFNKYDSDHSSLKKIISEFYTKPGSEPMNMTCYIQSQCNLGVASLCIAWINTCDGIVQCIDGTDEEHCWQLEINECKDDEFRCINGQCIPFKFFDDNPNAPDCFDGSDEHSNQMRQNPTGPVFKLEEIACLRLFAAAFSSLVGRKFICSESYVNRIRESIVFADQPNTISTDCWSALNCYLKLIKPWNYSNCNDICQSETCKKIINEKCPDMFFMPSAPIAFGHIYFAYTKQYVAEQKEWTNVPEYICYKEQLCGGFYSNRTLKFFNNITCRRPQDFPLEILSAYPGVSWLDYYVRRIYIELYKCNTILQSVSTFCNRSTMYQCINSSKCIAQIRLFDDKRDCDYGDDEEWALTDRNCPIKSPTIYVNCTQKNTCISRKRFDDGACECGSDTYGLCDDEPKPEDYVMLHISLPKICDNFTHLKPILINGQNETDETECAQWPCNNIYTRCNGILNCLNGDDELGCYPSSLINCSLPSYVCFSFETYDYICLSADKLNDGNIDCVGGVDEIKLCKDATPRDDGIFFCKNTSIRNCILRS